VTACGLWLGRRGLAAVLADGGGRVRLSTTIPTTPSARAALVALLAETRADLVLDEALLPADPIAFVARHAGVRVWVAGPPLVASLREVAGVARGPPRASAALLARIPAILWLRDYLRRLEPDDEDPRRVPLL
jgi:predicted NBD/HSP70 family sugar kinase